MAPAEEILGLLLAGGASTRLGRDKAPLLLPGSSLSLAENARRILEQAGLPVVVAARDLERAEFLLPGCRAVADGPGRGPAAALLGAHAAFPSSTLIALACDMPLVPPDFLRLLIEVEGDWVVPAWRGESSTKAPPGTAELQLGSGRRRQEPSWSSAVPGAKRATQISPSVPSVELLKLEPLCALYRPAALAALARRVAAGRFDLRGLAEEEGVTIGYLGGEQIATFGDPAAIFRNINEPRDFEAFAALRQAPCRPG